MSDATTAAILVLSDLHLGDDFGGSVEIPPLDSTPWARLFGLPTLERFIANRCIPHDTGILRSLPLYLPRVLADLRRQGHESGKFDACLLLGDLVTWPGEESYQLLRQYLTAERFE